MSGNLIIIIISSATECMTFNIYNKQIKYW